MLKFSEIKKFNISQDCMERTNPPLTNAKIITNSKNNKYKILKKTSIPVKATSQSVSTYNINFGFSFNWIITAQKEAAPERGRLLNRDNSINV